MRHVQWQSGSSTVPLTTCIINAVVHGQAMHMSVDDSDQANEEVTEILRVPDQKVLI